MKQKEHDLQVACVTWFHCQYPNELIYPIPNGGQRNIVVAVKLKAEGVVSGMPDLAVASAKKGFHGLYIELKVGKNKPTANQISIIYKLSSEGYKCSVCYSLDEFMRIVNNYLRQPICLKNE
ncbi:MAG: VRR-NUC domain-containing protein [Tannerella sp.]|jgi:hypothetical protein|nr:VRR-NUC domain-containing protein [Tannerella sp.]